MQVILFILAPFAHRLDNKMYAGLELIISKDYTYCTGFLERDNLGLLQRFCGRWKN